MILRVLAFLGAALAGYVATVIAAFVYWDVTGASGADYTPLLVVLLGVAPVVAFVCGAVLFLRLAPPEPPSRVAELEGWRRQQRSAAPPPSARRNGPLQVALAIGVALLVGLVLLWLGAAPHVLHLPASAVR
ncbi:MAG: hypothetical protein U1E14_20635 [Geminicoccaceae bacterium]